MKMPEVSIRQLRSEDIQDVLRLSREAGWNQTASDWLRLLELATEGCWGIEVAGGIVATTTVVCYGTQLAWVGMVLTDARYRGNGFATRLVGQALKRAQDFGVRCIKLDATDAGRPVYERLGFRAEQTIERWVKQGSGAAVHPSGRTLSLKPELDRSACGYDRMAWLKAMRREGGTYVHPEGVLLTRSGLVNAYLGPCVAEDARAARELLEHALGDNRECGWFWDLLPSNREAVELARTFDFAPCRSLTRMQAGESLPAKEHAVYAIAGFELG